jgi:hypothetical protein
MDFWIYAALWVAITVFVYVGTRGLFWAWMFFSDESLKHTMAMMQAAKRPLLIISPICGTLMTLAVWVFITYAPKL